MRWPLRCFSSAASFSANQVPPAAPADSHVHGEHHALRHVEVAGQQPRQRRLELVGLDLGEVAELADVDAEDRHRRRVHEIDRVEHRAVAAERDHEVETVGESLGRDAELAEPARLGFGLGNAHLDTALGEPAGRRARELVRDAAVAMRDQPDRARRRRAHTSAPSCAAATTRSMSASSTTAGPRRARARRTRRCRRRPAAATAPARARRAPTRRGRRRRRAARASCTTGSRTMPPLPTRPAPPRTAASPATRSRRRQSSAGTDWARRCATR